MNTRTRRGFLKNTILFSGAVGISAVLTRCNLDRISLNAPTSAGFPQNGQEAEMGLLGAYKEITTLDAASTPIWHVMDNITDIGYARPSNNYTSAITSSFTTDNALATKPWQIYYKVIARVHSVLDNLSKLKGSMNDQDLLQYDAELRSIRAYCYSQLISLYGDVPLVKHTIDLNNADLARTPKKEIQKFISDELSAVADNLPVSQAQYGNARISQVAAYMLKARIELEAQNFQAAADAADKAITLSAGNYSLTPFNESINYVGQDYSVGEPDITNIYGHDGFKSSNEWIWVAEYNQAISGDTHNEQYYSSSRLAKGCAYWGPTQDLIDSFQCKDGLSILESSLYDQDNPFKNRDPRLDMYCARPHSRFVGFQFEPNKKYANVMNYWPVINGDSNSPSSITNTDATNAYRSFSGYFWRKNVDISDYPTTSVHGVSDLNVGILRFAELLLIYAEAKIEANDIDSSVYESINKIRRRAHMPDLPQGLTQEQLRTALRYERKIELAGDGLRWFDLRRWGIGKKNMNGYIYLNRSGNSWKKDALKSFDENYTPIYDHDQAAEYFNTQEVVFQAGKDEVWPVPQSEIDADSKLVQNNGY